jgi:hypothetical protein
MRSDSIKYIAHDDRAGLIGTVTVEISRDTLADIIAALGDSATDWRMREQRSGSDLDGRIADSLDDQARALYAIQCDTETPLPVV